MVTERCVLQSALWRTKAGLAVGLVVASVSAQARAADPIAKTDGEQPGHRLEVTELKRTSGGTLMLRIDVVNESDKGMDFGDTYGQPSTNDYYNIGGVHLIDDKNKKKYLVVRDSKGTCLCSGGLKSAIPAGGRLAVWARFPAPPESVEKIGIVFPHFIPMDDVPIAK